MTSGWSGFGGILKESAFLCSRVQKGCQGEEPAVAKRRGTLAGQSLREGSVAWGTAALGPGAREEREPE